MRNKGFTVLELVILITILSIIALIVGEIFVGGKDQPTKTKEVPELIYSDTSPSQMNTTLEPRVECMSGFLFMIGSDGSIKQVLDSSGAGAVCDTAPSK